MRLGNYLSDKMTILLTHIAGLFLLLLFLKLEGNNNTVLCIIAVIWIIVVCIWLSWIIQDKNESMNKNLKIYSDE